MHHVNPYLKKIKIKNNKSEKIQNLDNLKGTARGVIQYIVLLCIIV